METSAPASRGLSPAITTVGFVGVGNMGNPMAANLVKAGWTVIVFDADGGKSRAFAESRGGTAAASLADLGKRSNVVITMLPDGFVVRKVVLGASATDDCLAKGLAQGAVVIDMSSSSPVGTRALGPELAKHGVALLDAPVSGGVKGAVAATLAIMVGGDRELAGNCDPLLSAMGRRFYVGTLGSGHAAKVLNNYVSAAGLAAAAEGMLIGQRFGIEPAVLLDVINASTGRNNSTENKFAQYILNRKFNSGFALALMAKDLALAMELAQSCEVPAELGHATLKLWKEAEAQLGASADHTEIARFVEKT